MKTSFLFRWIRAAAAVVAVGFSFTAVADIPASVYVQDGLVGHWDGIENAGVGRHDNAATTWADLAGGIGDATRKSDKVVWQDDCWTNGVNGTPFEVDSDFAKALATKCFTLEVRVRPTRTADRETIIGNYSAGQNFNLEHNGTSPTGCFRFYCNNAPSWGTPATVAAGEVVSAAFVAPADGYPVAYKNGVLAGTHKAKITASMSGNHGTIFGGEYNRTSMAFRGAFYSVRLYNRALTAEEVAWNAAVDKVRYEGADFPDGYRYNDETGKVECRVTLMAAEGGQVAAGESAAATSNEVWVAKGSVLTFSAVSDDGYQLQYWVGGGPDIDKTALSQTITVGTAQVLIAKFYRVGETSVRYIPVEYLEGREAQWVDTEMHMGYGQSFAFRWSVSPDFATYSDFGTCGSWSLAGDGLNICGAGTKQAKNYPLYPSFCGGLRGEVKNDPRWDDKTFTIGDIYEDVCTLGPLITYSMERLRDHDIRFIAPVANPKGPDFVSSDTIYLLRSRATSYYMSNKRVHGASLTDAATGAALMNLVPVVVEEDVDGATVETPAFYDTVRDKVLTNMTKTALRVGPKKTDNIRWNVGKLEFLVTVSVVGGGAFKVGDGGPVTSWSQWVAQGTSVQLTAIAAEGAVFRSWGGDVGTTDHTTTTVLMTADRARTIVANFSPEAEAGKYWTMELSNTVVHAASGARLKVALYGNGGLSVKGFLDPWEETELDLHHPFYSSDGSHVYPVENIADSAFKNNTAIEHVIMPDTVTNIEASAFYGCTALKFVRLSTNVVAIGGGAFQKGVDSSRRFFYPEMLPHSVVSIGGSAFNAGYVSNDVLIVDNPKLKSWGGNTFLSDRFRVMDFSRCGVVKTGDGFADANGRLETVIFPKVLQELTYNGVYFLGGCGGLKAIKIPGDPFEMAAASVMGNIGASSLCWYLPKWNKKWEAYLADPERCAVTEVASKFCGDYVTKHVGEELPVQMLEMGTKSPTVRQKAFGLRWWYPDAPPVYEPVDYFDVLSWEGQKVSVDRVEDALLFDGTTWTANADQTNFVWIGKAGASVTCDLDQPCKNARALKLTGYRLYQACITKNTVKPVQQLQPNGRAPTAWKLEGRRLRDEEWVTIDEQTMTAESPQHWAYFDYATYSETVPARTNCVLEYAVDAEKQDCYIAFRFTPLASRNTGAGTDATPYSLMEIAFVGMVTTPQPLIGEFAVEEPAWNSIYFTGTVTGFGDDGAKDLHGSSAIAWVEVSETDDFAAPLAVSPRQDVSLSVAQIYTVAGLAGNSNYWARLVVSNDLDFVSHKTLAEKAATLTSPFALGDPVASTNEQGKLTVDFTIERLYAASATVKVFAAGAPGAELALVKEVTVTEAGKVEFGEIDYAPGGTAVIRVDAFADGSAESRETAVFGVWLVDSSAGTITDMKTKASFKVTIANGADLTLSARGEIGEVTAFDFTEPFLDTSGNSYRLVSAGTVFKGDAKTVEILLPDTITEIGKEAFSDMVLMVKLRLPAQLEKIGEKAFYGCVQLQDVSPLFPVTCTNFGASAFASCSMLLDFILSDEITSLPNSLFHSCKALKNVRLPAKLQKMGSGVFWYCYGLTNVVPYIPYALSGTIPDYIFNSAPVRTERLCLDNPNITGFGAGPFGNNQFKYVDLSKTRITSISSPWAGNSTVREIIFPKTLREFTGTVFHSFNGGNNQSVDVQFQGDVPAITFTSSQALFYNTSTSTKFLFRADYANRSWREYIETYLDREVDIGDGKTAVFVRRPTADERATFKQRFPSYRCPYYMIRLQPYEMMERYVYFRWMPKGVMLIVR